MATGPGSPAVSASASASDSAASTPSSVWVDTIRTALGTAVSGIGGANNSHYNYQKYRKSLQTAVLFEAKRSVDAAQRQLKSYERKFALMRQSHFLLNALASAGGIITLEQRNEVLWKTASSRQVLDAETAWRRIKAVERELDGLAQQIKPYYYGHEVNNVTTHDEAVNRMVRAQYDANPPTDYVKAHKDMMGTRDWEFAHNHLLFTFRLYYKGSHRNPDLPPPMELVISSAGGMGGGEFPAYGRSRPNAATSTSSTGRKNEQSQPGGDMDDGDEEGAGMEGPLGPRMPAAGMGAAAGPVASNAHVVTAIVDPVADERRQLLREVKDHLEILKEFEGLVPADELAQRKRELYLSLPPAPPPVATTASNAAAVGPQFPPLTNSPSRHGRREQPPTSSPDRDHGSKRSRS